MQVLKFRDHEPNIASEVYLAQGVMLIGNVDIYSFANIWFNSVVRGDVNKISIGENTNIQDLSMLHVTEENALSIGKNVTVGHSCTLHACTIEDHCLIGMGATILDGAVIGRGSVVAAGSIVPPGKVYPENSMIVGSPAKVKRALTPEEMDVYHNHYKSYLGYAKEYLDI